MTRTQLEHLVRASASVTGERDLVVIGSQAILGEHPNAPKELLLSNEADMYPMHDARKSILIDAEERIKTVMDGEFRSLRRVQSIAGRLGSYRRRFPEGEVQSVVHEQGMDVQWIVEGGGRRVYTAGTARDCREVALVLVHGAGRKREDLLVLERLVESRHRKQSARLRTEQK